MLSYKVEFLVCSHKFPLYITHKTEGSEKIHSLRNIDPPVLLENTKNYETLGNFSYSSVIILLGRGFEGDMSFHYGFHPSRKSAAKGIALFEAH